MSNKNPHEHSPTRAADLDALLHKGIQADKRATKPPMSAAPPAAAPQSLPPSYTVRPISASNPTLERLTVRFTQEEARLLEKARGVARSMGYKVSDTAVFRLALNSFNPDTMTTAALETILKADGRRR
jgi:hypothetical protein